MEIGIEMATHAGFGRRTWTPNPLFSAGRASIHGFLQMWFLGRILPGANLE
jgi:hypothetical protein